MAVAVVSIPSDQDSTVWNDAPSTSLENDAIFLFLDSYFRDSNIFEVPLDPYDGGSVENDRLPEFVTLLKMVRAAILNFGDEWVVKTENWDQGGRAYSRDYVAKKSEVLAVVDSLINLSTAASSSGKKLVFIGD